MAKQRSFPHGYTIKFIKGVGQSLLGGVYQQSIYILTT